MKEIFSSETTEQLVEEQLKNAGLEYEIQPIVGKGSPDFVVKTPDGEQIVLEVKAWPENKTNIHRAAHQVKLYEKVTNLVSYVAMAGLSSAIPDLRLLPVNGLISALEEAFKATKGRRARPTKRIETRHSDKKVFSAMPFAPKYDDTFLVAMIPAAISVKAVCERVDYSGNYGDIVQQIKTMISQSVAVIADLSESRPNVCYEIGLAHALGKPVIQISSTSMDQLPFDLRNNTTIKYGIGQTTRLKKHLIEELKKIDGLR